jgi:CheY-like chemotaxis protein
MITPEEAELITSDRLQCDTPPRGVRVLLVEDDRALRRYLEVLLERSGYEVVSAADGLEAMKILLHETIQAVITDAVMPNLNGYELSRFIRKSQQLAHLPIVLLSGSDQKDAPAGNEHVNAFLSKPVSTEELLECLEKLTVSVNRQ